MAENGSSNTAIVAIVILVLAAIAFAYFFGFFGTRRETVIEKPTIIENPSKSYR